MSVPGKEGRRRVFAVILGEGLTPPGELRRARCAKELLTHHTSTGTSNAGGARTYSEEIEGGDLLVTKVLPDGQGWVERRDAGVWLARSRDLKVWTNVSDEPVLLPGPSDYDGLIRRSPFLSIAHNFKAGDIERPCNAGIGDGEEIIVVADKHLAPAKKRDINRETQQIEAECVADNPKLN